MIMSMHSAQYFVGVMIFWYDSELLVVFRGVMHFSTPMQSRKNTGLRACKPRPDEFACAIQKPA